ncbi:MAG: hypothetical protein SGPRY_014833, partial [Prymnesium sp.]
FSFKMTTPMAGAWRGVPKRLPFNLPSTPNLEEPSPEPRGLWDCQPSLWSIWNERGQGDEMLVRRGNSPEGLMPASLPVFLRPASKADARESLWLHVAADIDTQRPSKLKL